MTTKLFIGLLIVMCLVSGLLTEALKKAFSDKISANMLALIDAVIVGGAGTAIAYVLMGIAFTVNNIICIGLMVFAVWIGSMVGYDKIKQTVEQIIEILS